MADYYLPSVIVLLVAFLVPAWSIRRRWVSVLLCIGYTFLLARYMTWRLTETVAPAEMPSVTGAFVWFVFFVEFLVWCEGLILMVVVLNRTNRSPEADAHEVASHQNPAESLPNVDVFIATYNEPLEVLEKTIAGAMAIDWPRERLHIHVLDDGRRDWLRSYCEERGVVHLTREGNDHAKAGNINAALGKTQSPFILVLDADFVPFHRILRRSIGFFDDPRVGIVQMPHHFFNPDPLQLNLNLEALMPDEQRLFFDVIQPGRDGLDCAFCCGSNGILRRKAMEEIGGEMPTDSITEDMLLTLALLRKGYVTRFLNERLAIGLAPENIQAYFVQRARWAQGAIQIFYTKHGPFGPGLKLVQRILFVPSHWISLSFCQPVAVTVPAIFLLTGIPPLVNVTTAEIIFFQLPVVIGSILLMMHLAGDKFAPLSTTTQSLLQGLRIAPVVFKTLVQPKGHAFKVTPKGKDARTTEMDTYVVRFSLILFFLTGLGLFINSNDATRLVAERELLPVVAFWAAVNMVILLLVAAMAVPRTPLRSEERFVLEEPCKVIAKDDILFGELSDISIGGCQMRIDTLGSDLDLAPGTWTAIQIAKVGHIPAIVVRHLSDAKGDPCVCFEFQLESGSKRDRLIQRLFSDGLQSALPERRGLSPSLLMISRMVRTPAMIDHGSAVERLNVDSTRRPEWLLDSIFREDAAMHSLGSGQNGWIAGHESPVDTKQPLARG